MRFAKALGKDLHHLAHRFDDPKAMQGLYEYDAVSRLGDGQLGNARVHDIANSHQTRQCWNSWEADTAPVLLIDEIDKAGIE